MKSSNGSGPQQPPSSTNGAGATPLEVATSGTVPPNPFDDPAVLNNRDDVNPLGDSPFDDLEKLKRERRTLTMRSRTMKRVLSIF